MISCNDYDYIEIACTYQYPIILTLKSGEIIHCSAKDTSLNNEREECIKVEVGDAERLVVLDEVKIMEAKVDNPHFQSVRFN
ncbi:TPA: Rho-binding antiterminator [Pseudomonas aeruginosa]|uniref:Rho-binding antiterminator n=1 Tax=Vibrio TaxID=662 RepID=UPI001BD28695|nr:MULTISPECIES: Rho-binding antiterminator [Vibrio]HCF4213541.1 Rho-binding antiterminator [Pseudomonas aeruginosa]MBS9878473.1 Rho-binding antiterminator [Vibrio alginolyticus]MDW1939374.1 Rho-binding antiterminator [Vibrio sp. 818]MDW1985455.1 Rho-binding antiterminator [Vibrio sp. 811]MDW1996822.1 Rho-binding antiterminator [Vibrio sp. 299]